MCAYTYVRTFMVHMSFKMSSRYIHSYCTVNYYVHMYSHGIYVRMYGRYLRTYIVGTYIITHGTLCGYFILVETFILCREYYNTTLFDTKGMGRKCMTSKHKITLSYTCEHTYVLSIIYVLTCMFWTFINNNIPG